MEGITVLSRQIPQRYSPWRLGSSEYHIGWRICISTKCGWPSTQWWITCWSFQVLVAPLPLPGKKSKNAAWNPRKKLPSWSWKKQTCGWFLVLKSHIRLKLLYVWLAPSETCLPFSTVVQFHRCHDFVGLVSSSEFIFHPSSSKNMIALISAVEKTTSPTRPRLEYWDRNDTTLLAM